MQNQIIFLLCLVFGIGQELFAQSLQSAFAAQFSVKSFGYGKVNGNFQNIKGNIQLDTLDLKQSNFELQFDTKAIETGKKLVNNFVKGTPFFAVEQYPLMTFQSIDFLKTEIGFIVKGILTIKGQAIRIDIPFHLESSATALLMKGSICLNRFDFDLGRNYSKFLVKEKVNIELSAVLPHNKEAIQQIAYSGR